MTIFPSEKFQYTSSLRNDISIAIYILQHIIFLHKSYDPIMFSISVCNFDRFQNCRQKEEFKHKKKAVKIQLTQYFSIIHTKKIYFSLIIFETKFSARSEF